MCNINIQIDNMQKKDALVVHLQSRLSDLDSNISGTILPDLKDDIKTLRKEVRDADRATLQQCKACANEFKSHMEDLRALIAEVDKTLDIEIMGKNQDETKEALKEVHSKTSKLRNQRFALTFI